MSRGVSFEPRADGRAAPVERDDGSPRRCRGPWREGTRALVALAALAALNGIGFAAIEALPPLLPFLFVGLNVAIVLVADTAIVLRRRHAYGAKINVLLRDELTLCQQQREDGRARIRALTRQLNGLPAEAAPSERVTA